MAPRTFMQCIHTPHQQSESAAAQAALIPLNSDAYRCRPRRLACHKQCPEARQNSEGRSPHSSNAADERLCCQIRVVTLTDSGDNVAPRLHVDSSRLFRTEDLKKYLMMGRRGAYSFGNMVELRIPNSSVRHDLAFKLAVPAAASGTVSRPLDDVYAPQCCSQHRRYYTPGPREPLNAVLPPTEKFTAGMSMQLLAAEGHCREGGNKADIPPSAVLQ
ncbi:hypothetical protein JKP88DRAFT_250673 [Tribonema minus]|uniref:Uncharacterized protein n=1 Tax=Tribonema minus TaxID=303371 RepID=A0A836CP91_9STRA|nr:hypothetical protein JKP88DRAFT_250673 [Tribonema minus]